ncbi:hypothetical protein [Poriferisphaera sp. WC338]|uniref:hypothetical protein n=1 Tax=Poriferisphaera sp. WC338 TaxID=3425129 RepID=UPI003D818F6B
MNKGDTVATLNGQLTARVCDIAQDDEEVNFVCLRPIHQPYARGIWYAEDQVMWVSKGRKRKTLESEAEKAKEGKAALVGSAK